VARECLTGGGHGRKLRVRGHKHETALAPECLYTVREKNIMKRERERDRARARPRARPRARDTSSHRPDISGCSPARRNASTIAERDEKRPFRVGSLAARPGNSFISSSANTSALWGMTWKGLGFKV
jgi:hypothetical protein